MNLAWNLILQENQATLAGFVDKPEDTFLSKNNLLSKILSSVCLVTWIIYDRAGFPPATLQTQRSPSQTKPSQQHDWLCIIEKTAE